MKEIDQVQFSLSLLILHKFRNLQKKFYYFFDSKQ